MSEEVDLDEDAAARQAFLLNQLKSAANTRPFNKGEDQVEGEQASSE
ncbi:MAG TPA: hypothetical protein VHV57_06120 [Acidimicrobiales bacterium]|nr:hypothetical protein [Acidimicrobiales bacterium]